MILASPVMKQSPPVGRDRAALAPAHRSGTPVTLSRSSEGSNTRRRAGSGAGWSGRTRSGLSFPEAFKKLTPVREKEYLDWDFYVKGFIDAVENVDGKIRLMDYKTSKRAKLSDEYKLQLAIYAMLYELEHKEKPHEVGIYFLKFKGGEAEQVLPVDEELIKHAKFKVEQIHASTTTDNIGDFPLNKTPLCKWSTGQCDFYDYCYNGKEIPPLPEPKEKS